MELDCYKTTFNNGEMLKNLTMRLTYNSHQNETLYNKPVPGIKCRVIVTYNLRTSRSNRLINFVKDYRVCGESDQDGRFNFTNLYNILQ